jgi:uncharacterized peroxidase-related enzyme
MTFTIHDTQSAPAGSQDILDNVEQQFGFLPNIMGAFAESPATLQAYLQLDQLMSNETAFTPTEQQVVLMSVSRANNCDYCMSAHSTIANSQNVDEDVIQALRDGNDLPDEKLAALQAYTLELLNNHGHVSEDVKKQFTDQGYGPRHALEVVLGIAMKTISNYTNHLAHTPLDEQFKPSAWHNEAA